MSGQLLETLPKLRPSLRNLFEKCTEFWKKNKGNSKDLN